jgi:hypothetical protein
VRRLLCVPLPLLSVFLRRAATPVLVLLWDSLFGPLRLHSPYVAFELLSCAPLVRMLPV